MCCKIIIDFTDPHKIYVVYELSAVFATEGNAEAERTFRIVYVLNAKNGNLDRSYDLSFGGSHAIFRNGRIVRSEESAVRVPVSVSPDQDRVTVGNSEMEFPFTEKTPVWTGEKIFAGDKVTFSGTLSFNPESADNVPAVYLFSGYVLGYWQTSKEPFNFSAEGLSVQYSSGSVPFDSLAPVNGGLCEIVFDWTESNRLIISVTCKKDGAEASASLTLTGMSEEGYYIGLGGENCYYSATVSRTSAK